MIDTGYIKKTVFLPHNIVFLEAIASIGFEYESKGRVKNKKNFWVWTPPPPYECKIIKYFFLKLDHLLSTFSKNDKLAFEQANFCFHRHQI